MPDSRKLRVALVQERNRGEAEANLALIETRVAEAFLSRIATERGRPVRALGLVERQLDSYGGGLGKVEPQDAFGAALLLHRAL